VKSKVILNIYIILQTKYQNDSSLVFFVIYFYFIFYLFLLEETHSNCDERDWKKRERANRKEN